MFVTNFNLTYLQIMKKFIITALTIVFLASCSSDPNDENIITNANKISTDLVAFKNQDDFEKTIKNLSNLKEHEDFQNWIKSEGHKSLLNNITKLNKKQTDALPLALIAIFNENFEFKIGDNIISFKDGIFYETNSSNILNVKKIGTSEIVTIPVDEKLQSKTLGVNGTYKEYKQFKRISYGHLCGTPTSSPLHFRLVHELKAIQSSVNSFGYSELSMNFRMSYDAGNGWADANSTERLLSYYLSGYFSASSGFWNNGGSQSFSISGDYGCGNPAIGNIRKVIAVNEYIIGFGASPVWSVNINGGIIHQVNGDDYSNEWNHSINW